MLTDLIDSLLPPKAQPDPSPEPEQAEPAMDE